MKQRILSMVLRTSLLVVSTGITTGSCGKRPALGALNGGVSLTAIGARVYDAGIIEEGPPIEWTFHLENRGEEQVKIARVVPSCGCTDAQMDRLVLAPGENANLRMTVDTSNNPGRLSVTCQVVTSESTRSPLVFGIKGNVGRAQVVDLERTRLDFGGMRLGGIATKRVRVTIKHRWGKPLPRVGLWDLDPSLAESVRVEYQMEDSAWQERDFICGSGELVVHMRPAHAGRIVGKIVGRSADVPGVVLAELLLVANVHDTIEFEVPSQFFDKCDVGARSQASVRIAYMDKGLKAANGEIAVTGNDPWLSGKLEVGHGDDLGVLHIYAVPSEDGFSSSGLRISAGEHWVEFPVQAYARKK